MIKLDSLSPFEGSRHSKKRIGRGQGSGHGKTACKGEKGQTARSGGGVRPGFEGGQMPLFRRLPKRGFKNPFRKEYGVINVKDLADVSVDGTVDIDIAKSKGRIPKKVELFKVLGEGELGKAVVVKAHAVSRSARDKIEAAGGRVEILSSKEGA